MKGCSRNSRKSGRSLNRIFPVERENKWKKREETEEEMTNKLSRLFLRKCAVFHFLLCHSSFKVSSI
jgi:hypothetical protein